MPHIGTTELIIILVIFLLIFGAGKLASIGGAVGKGVKDFREAMKSTDDDEEKQSAKSATPADGELAASASVQSPARAAAEAGSTDGEGVRA